MTEPYPTIVSQLKSILEQECRLQTEYISSLAQEQKAMIPFDAARVEECNQKRSDLCDRMSDLQEKRKDLVRALTGGGDMRLSSAIEAHCTSRDKQLLFPLVRRLKELIHTARSGTHEFNDITSFSLGLVSGLLSIVTSSRREVSRSYSGRGVLKEAYHPSGSRLSDVLKQA